MVIVSDSETALRVFESFRFIICFCFAMIVFFRVFLFDLLFPTVCLCGVITKLYL